MSGNIPSLKKLKELTADIAHAISDGDAQQQHVFDVVKFLLDMLPVPSVIVDADYVVAYMNPSMTDFVEGVKPDTGDLVGKVCYEEVAGLDAPCNGCMTRDALKVGMIVDGIVGNPFPSGRRYTVRVIPLWINGIVGVIEMILGCRVEDGESK